jgi:hypothetical protein
MHALETVESAFSLTPSHSVITIAVTHNANVPDVAVPPVIASYPGTWIFICRPCIDIVPFFGKLFLE